MEEREAETEAYGLDAYNTATHTVVGLPEPGRFVYLEINSQSWEEDEMPARVLPVPREYALARTARFYAATSKPRNGYKWRSGPEWREVKWTADAQRRKVQILADMQAKRERERNPGKEMLELRAKYEKERDAFYETWHREQAEKKAQEEAREIWNSRKHERGTWRW